MNFAVESNFKLSKQHPASCCETHKAATTKWRHKVKMSFSKGMAKSSILVIFSWSACIISISCLSFTLYAVILWYYFSRLCVYKDDDKEEIMVANRSSTELRSMKSMGKFCLWSNEPFHLLPLFYRSSCENCVPKEKNFIFDRNQNMYFLFLKRI